MSCRGHQPHRPTVAMTGIRILKRLSIHMRRASGGSRKAMARYMTGILTNQGSGRILSMLDESDNAHKIMALDDACRSGRNVASGRPEISH